MKTILVPTDFSANATNAARYATELAKSLDARVILFHAVELPVVATDIPQPVETIDWMERENRKKLAKLGKKLEAQLPDRIETSITPVVDMVSQEILRFAKRIDADLIIMGTRGTNKLLDRLFGTVATGVVRHTHIPVILVPERYHYNYVGKIVVGCDNAEAFTPPVVSSIRHITEFFRASLVLLKIFGVGDYFQHGAEIEGREGIDKKLGDVKHSYAYEVNEDFAEGIDTFANKEKADLVVLLPQTHTLLNRIFEGSITKRLAMRTHKPLLILPPKLPAKKAAEIFAPPVARQLPAKQGPHSLVHV